MTVFFPAESNLSLSHKINIIVVNKLIFVAPFTAAIVAHQITITVNPHNPLCHNSGIRPKIRHHVLTVILICNPFYFYFAIINIVFIVFICESSIIAPFTTSVISEQIIFSVNLLKTFRFRSIRIIIYNSLYTINYFRDPSTFI